MRNKEYSWYMLSNAPGFGAKSIHYIFKNLQANNMSVNDLFDTDLFDLYRLFPEIGSGKLSRANFSSFAKLDADDRLYSNFEELKSNGVTIIGLDDERYPKSVLQNMGDNAPPILYCKGYLPLLNQKGVSIVGARDVNSLEVDLAKEISYELATNGWNIVSGYARGVDTAAHIGALEAGGTTSMILSFGINHASIKTEAKYLSWEKNSLFVSQFAPMERFSGKNAMIRNELVCALSMALVVIKAGPERDSNGKMSGTFDAGKTALKMGIPVFVLNPQVLNPQSQGNIDLIKLGGIEFSNGIEIVKFFEELSGHENVLKNEQGEKNKVDDKKGKNSINKPYQTRLFE